MWWGRAIRAWLEDIIRYLQTHRDTITKGEDRTGKSLVIALHWFLYCLKLFIVLWMSDVANFDIHISYHNQIQ